MKISSHKHLATKALLLGSCLLLNPMSSWAEIDSSAEQVTRLTLQGQIDTGAPLSKSLWAGAHNAFASFQWSEGDYTDVNQWYSPKSLFWRGIRVVEYDVYPMSASDNTPKLCHLGLEEATKCSWTFVTVASLATGLDQLSDYLSTHKDEVLMLKLEAYDSDYHNNFRNLIGDKIKDKLGDYVFKPEDWGYNSGDCSSLPVQTLRKQDVLDAGKNIIIVTQIPRKKDLCNYHDEDHASKYLEWVWIGVDEFDSSGNLASSEAFCQNKDQCAKDEDGDETFSAHYALGNFSVALDATTEYKKGEIELHGDEVLAKAKEGANILELALVEANSTTIGASKAPQIEDYVWSWNSGEPNNANNNEDCAVSRSDGTLNDANCTQSKRFACVDDDRNWQISTVSGSWEQGSSACAALGNFHFAMPYNARENQDLLNAKSDAGITTAWLNYHDQNIEGVWQANTEYEDIGYSKSVARGDASAGDAFDDLDMLKRKLLGSGALKLKSIRITEGDNGLFRYVRMCYQQSQVVSHATASNNEICKTHGKDDGGRFSEITLSSSGYIKAMQYCVDDDNGKDRVVYLKFTSNGGASIAKGTCTGTSYSLNSGDQIFALHGRASSDYVWSLGAHSIDASQITPPLYATDWLDRDNPSSGDDERFTKQQSSGNISATCAASDVAGIVARVVGNKLDSSLTGQKLVNDSTGFACWNSDNGGNSSNTTCEDYEVKYFFTKASCLP
ncbi:jacalin-like lectin [Shewanella baltica]|uniref:jacalin-like lectin n=1 Tax=Shewanella baltica TaxID=62322 RepID=UPI0032185FC4